MLASALGRGQLHVLEEQPEVDPEFLRLQHLFVGEPQVARIIEVGGFHLQCSRIRHFYTFGWQGESGTGLNGEW